MIYNLFLELEVVELNIKVMKHKAPLTMDAFPPLTGHPTDSSFHYLIKCGRVGRFRPPKKTFERCMNFLE